jgi:cytoskeletal protein RodZ
MIKILVDRANPTSEKIKNRQDFDSILKQHKQSIRSTVLPWYFGVVGIASFVLAIMSILL